LTWEIRLFFYPIMLTTLKEARAHLKLAEDALENGKFHKALFLTASAMALLNRIQQQVEQPDEDDISPFRNPDGN